MTDFPEQRDWLRADYEARIDNAIEELVRWASPVMTFRRTAVTETELGGRKIVPGDKVVLFHPSGNRAPTCSPTRRGSTCPAIRTRTSASVVVVRTSAGQPAREECVARAFHELLTRIPGFEVGEPELLGTNFMRGVKRMPFRSTPEG